MTGKVFKDSSNIYEDEARVLFAYYKKAAEAGAAQKNRRNRGKDTVSPLRTQCRKK